MFYVPEKDEIQELIIEMFKSGFTEKEITSVLEMNEEECTFQEEINSKQDGWLRDQNEKNIRPKKSAAKKSVAIRKHEKPSNINVF